MKIIKLFKKQPKIYNMNDEKLEQGIIISNHSAASGPLTLSLYFPVFFIPWGTYEMTGKYKERWNYLYHIFYQQKLGYSKFKSFIIATLFAVISKILYNSMQLVPTYPNVNFRKTIELSKAHLNKGNNILIFPEDSNTGYHEHLIKYNNGFAYLSESYYKDTNINLPIYPIYYHKILNAMIIGEAVDIKNLRDNKMSRDEISNYFKDLTNKINNPSKIVVNLINWKNDLELNNDIIKNLNLLYSKDGNNYTTIIDLATKLNYNNSYTNTLEVELNNFNIDEAYFKFELIKNDAFEGVGNLRIIIQELKVYTN